MTASFSLYAKNVRLPDHATELAAMAADRLVIAAGGDGTLNEALNGLPQGPHNYCTLLIRLEAAHSAVEAAVEVRRRLRLNEGVITLPTYVGVEKVRVIGWGQP